MTYKIPDHAAVDFAGTNIAYTAPAYNLVNFNLSRVGADPGLAFLILRYTFEHLQEGLTNFVDVSSYHRSAVSHDDFRIVLRASGYVPMGEGAMYCPYNFNDVGPWNDTDFDLGVNDFTIACWFQAVGVPNAGNGIWFISCWSSEGYSAYRFGIFNNGSQYVLRFQFFDSTNTERIMDIALIHQDIGAESYRYGVDRYNGVMSLYQQPRSGDIQAAIATAPVGDMRIRWGALQVRVPKLEQYATGYLDNFSMYNGYSRFRGTLPDPGPEPDHEMKTLTMTGGATLAGKKALTMMGLAAVQKKASLSTTGAAFTGRHRLLTAQGGSLLGLPRQLKTTSARIKIGKPVQEMGGTAILARVRISEMGGTAVLEHQRTATRSARMGGIVVLQKMHHADCSGSAVLKKAVHDAAEGGAILGHSGLRQMGGTATLAKEHQATAAATGFLVKRIAASMGGSAVLVRAEDLTGLGGESWRVRAMGVRSQVPGADSFVRIPDRSGVKADTSASAWAKIYGRSTALRVTGRSTFSA